MGVDLVENYAFNIANTLGSGYKRADQLWTKLQESMFNFINNNSGVAEFYGPKNIKARPDYANIEQFLFNQIDYVELKRRLGCL